MWPPPRPWAADEIDNAAGRARLRYLTSVPGQDATYTAKYQQALAYVAAGYPADMTAFPWIAQEALRTGQTAQAAANTIKSTGDAWALVIGPRIEGLRIGGKYGLIALTTIPAVLGQARAAITALAAV